MSRPLDDGTIPTHRTAGVEQVFGVVDLAAVFTLVSSSIFIAAVRTFPFDVAVSQKPLTV